MIQKVINSIEKIDNNVAKDLLAIFNNTQPNVDEAYYTSTVFKTQEKYRSYNGILNGVVVGSVQKQMVETPLVFIRAKQQPVFCSEKNQGISFGFTMVDYRSSFPLVIVMVTKVDKNYEYKSIMFDKESNTFIDSETSIKACKTIDDLLNHVSKYTIKDVAKWINKY
jgi:hypothetical protein